MVKLSLEYAKVFATAILSFLNGQGEIAGSIAREERYISDIDIVTNLSPVSIVQRLTNALPKGTVKKVNCGPKKCSLSILGTQVDFYCCTMPNWEPMRLYLTGDKTFNIVLRNRAKRLGFSLSQYGLTVSPNKIITNEKDIFHWLRFSYIEPKHRNFNDKNRKKHIMKSYI